MHFDFSLSPYLVRNSLGNLALDLISTGLLALVLNKYSAGLSRLEHSWRYSFPLSLLFPEADLPSDDRQPDPC